jgi:hypothetical protein
MKFLLLLWTSQHPSLINTEQGNQHIASAALQWTHDYDRMLVPYERSLLQLVARQEITLGHLLAYLQEQEQD